MAHSYHHAASSARRYGGSADEYVALHSFMDSSKQAWGDQRHRAVLHHSVGIYITEQVIGAREEVRLLRAAVERVPRWLRALLGITVPATTPVTLTLQSGKQVPIRLLAEQHVLEDCGFIPSLKDYLGNMPKEPWMHRGAAPLHRWLDTEQPLPPLPETSATDLAAPPSSADTTHA